MTGPAAELARLARNIWDGYPQTASPITRLLVPLGDAARHVRDNGDEEEYQTELANVALTALHILGPAADAAVARAVERQRRWREEHEA